MTTVDPVSGRRVPARRRLAVVNALTLLALRTPLVHGLLDSAVCELRFTGRRSGRVVTLPVMYARQGGDLIVLVGGAAGKTWWRSFAQPHVVHVRLQGVWHEGIGRTVPAGAEGRPTAGYAYHARFPRVRVDDADPFVVITLPPDGQTGRLPEGRRP